MTEPYRQTVYNFHLDGYAHVNNARYPEFLEAARWHFFRQHGLSAALRQMQLVVSHMDIRYRRAAALDDELAVYSRLTAVQSRQIRVEQTVYCCGKVCIQAQIELMPTDDAGRVCRLSADMQRQLEDLCQAA